MIMEMIFVLLDLVWLKNYLNIFSYKSQSKEITLLTASIRNSSWITEKKVGSKYHTKILSVETLNIGRILFEKQQRIIPCVSFYSFNYVKFKGVNWS